MEKLYHQASKPLECPRNSDCRADFDEDAFCGVNEDLKPSGFVDRRVEEGKETLIQRVSVCNLLGRVEDDLVGDVGSGFADIPPHLTHHSDVLIAVE